MRIVLWIGNQPNQRALANKIHERFPLSGIITETRRMGGRISIKTMVEKVIEKILLFPIGKAWRKVQEHYNKVYPTYPGVEVVDVENINSIEAFNFTQRLKPDLILVSGTRLIKQQMLSVNPKVGILNLHTGLSPYIKGGPNCTNWCLATKQFHLIGNTVMWIDSGIDSGNILTTAFADITGRESLPQLHLKVMEQAHQLYLDSISYLNDGFTQSVMQDSISSGRTYYNRKWRLMQQIELLLNYPKLKNYYTSGKFASDRKGIKTVELRSTFVN